MTSPTTSADAATLFSLLMNEPFGETTLGDILCAEVTAEGLRPYVERVAKKYAPQHAEAGAVAWIYKECHGHQDECWIERVSRTLPVWKHWDVIPLFLHPAQPASQQGEVTEMMLCEIDALILHPGQLYRFTAADGCQACADYLSPVPHPTGDKVRIAGQKLSNLAYNLAQRHDLPAGYQESLDAARKEWDAALDQEKNDGR